MEDTTNYKKKIRQSVKKIGLTLVFSSLILSGQLIGGTKSYFSDQATAKGMSFTAADDFYSAGAVVINEIMWMGSEGDPGDEWIELKNTTDKDVDLSNWQVEGAGTGHGSHIEIPAKYTIKAGGYFLILHNKWNDTAIKLESDLDKDKGMTHVAGMDLNDAGEALVLEDASKNIIDTAWKNDSAWPAGADGVVKESMERNDHLSDGTKDSAWHTCETDDSFKYWKDKNQHGTPGGDNM